jgi:hypothetical protein
MLYKLPMETVHLKDSRKKQPMHPCSRYIYSGNNQSASSMAEYCRSREYICIYLYKYHHCDGGQAAVALIIKATEISSGSTRLNPEVLYRRVGLVVFDPEIYPFDGITPSTVYIA